MRRTIIFLSLLMLACMSASATTHITSCGYVITAAGYYDLTADLTSNGTSDCISLSSAVDVSPHAISLQCNGHSITYTPSTLSPYFLLKGNGTLDNMYFYVQNCTFSAPNISAPAGLVEIHDTFVNWQYNTFDRVVGNFYNSLSNCYSCTAQLYSNTLTTSGLYVYGYHDTIMWYNTANFNESVNSFPCLIGAGDIAQGINFQYNTLTGYNTTTSVDDAICINNSGAEHYGNIYVKHNTLSQVYDSGIEFTGYFGGGDISNNDISYFGFGGIRHHINLGQNNMLYNSNTFSHACSTCGLYRFYNNQGSPDPNAYFKNVSITNTVYDNGVSTLTDYIGYYLSYPNFAGNYLANNNFYTSTLYLGSYASNMTDGGSNYCGSSSTGAITCH